MNKWLLGIILISSLTISAPSLSQGLDGGISLPNFADLVERQIDTVVQIRIDTITEEDTTARSLGGEDGQATGFGSGFIVSSNGYIMTNAHVVGKESAVEITVTLHDRRQFTAKLIGFDTPTDVALIKIDAIGLQVATLGDSSKVRVGEWAMAIGAPYSFDNTVTVGIVSNIGRHVRGDSYLTFIQTDVAINPGNSGGPLFNTRGEVIGINSQIFSSSGGYQGIAFAIPINTAKLIANQLRNNIPIVRGWLGVQIRSVTRTEANKLQRFNNDGVYITAVNPNSPARQGGILEGDIILQFNNKNVIVPGDLQIAVGRTIVGTAVPVVVLRDNKEVTLMITIGTAPMAVATIDSDTVLGMTVSKIPHPDRKFGLTVTAVDPGSLSAVADIEKDDIILSINQTFVTTPKEFYDVEGKLTPGDTVLLMVERGSDISFKAITIE